MSTANRLISGSAAQWATIGVNMLSQLILVPIYLTYWDVRTYGIWLAISGIMSVISMLDMGYQTFMAYEFLRIGSGNTRSLSKSLSSAAVIGFCIGTLQIVVLGGLFMFGALPFLLGETQSDSELFVASGIALLLQGFLWLAMNTLPGLMVRVLAVFGYFPKTAWWGFANAILTAVSPIIAVTMGGDLLDVALAQTGASFCYTLLLYFALVKWLKREQIQLVKPSTRLGVKNLILSLPLVGKSLLENVRQQGVRLLLAPLAGASGLATFSTLRTGANVALQGLNTITHPLLPDLMRYLHNRDQARSEAAFSTLWIVVVACMAPGVVIMQVVMEPFFAFWTKGKIPFDPMLFALLSLSVLVYAVVQPAMAVVIGNNLTKTQLGLAILAAVVVLGLMGLATPFMGIVGTAMALLIAEIAAAIGYTIYAERWLREADMKWPVKIFQQALVSVAIAVVALAVMVIIPEIKIGVMGVALMLFTWNIWVFWNLLPVITVENARNIFRRIPGVQYAARALSIIVS